MSKDINLTTKLVGEITGKFFVPSYQRGYRWGSDEVTRLLEDIYANGNNNYCLQPVVIRRDGDRFELIDGQQRLTTLFILLQYIKREFKPKINLKYRITYKTREMSADYLDNIDEALATSNIDFFHIYGAYKAIDVWFNKQADSVVVADDIYGYLVKYVKIIWYEVGENEDAISLFTRLNIGKIPLTNAELVKAMFLSRDGTDNLDTEMQQEISLQWDNIEKELHNDSLWYFLTNSTTNLYQTRIDLVLDLIADKQEDTREKYYTFFKFEEMRKKEPKNLQDIWGKIIMRTFLTLKDWHEDHELYHKIGYLIASGIALHEIFQLSEGKTKDAFRLSLDDKIKSSINVSGNYGDLSYDRTADYKKIYKLLLLFNVESVRQNGEHTQWFPFDKFKYSKGTQIPWSLEHIHAQQSEGMRTQEVWKEWLKLHIPSVKAFGDAQDEMVQSMQSAVDNARLERIEFDALQQKVVALLSVSGNTEYLHSIANLALLNRNDNAALNNSTFDVKRNAIVEMDMAGQYIPYCTRMVFLKYYTPSIDNQLHFWGHPDRVAYVNTINTVLADYLPEAIVL